MTAAPQEHHHKTRKSVKERRRVYVERFPCSWCFATPGSPCDMNPSNPERPTGPHGDVYHTVRYKKAAGAAIDEILRRDGVRFDEDGAIDEAETRKSEPDVRPHLREGFKP